MLKKAAAEALMKNHHRANLLKRERAVNETGTGNNRRRNRRNFLRC